MLFLCKKCAAPYYIVIDGKVTPLEEVWDILPRSTSRCGQCGKGSTVGVETVNVGSTYFHYESEEAKKVGVYGILPAQYRPYRHFYVDRGRKPRITKLTRAELVEKITGRENDMSVPYAGFVDEVLEWIETKCYQYSDGDEWQVYWKEVE